MGCYEFYLVGKVMRLILTIALMLFATTAWATYLQRPQMVQLTTKDGVTSITLAPAGRVEVAVTKAGPVTFAWDPSTDEVDGYRLKCTGTQEITAETTDTWVEVEMPVGEYKCWATAYKGEEESGPSKNISVRITE